MDEILSPLIKDLLKLARFRCGIISIEDSGITLKVRLAFVIGDNLGVNELLGFKQCYWKSSRMRGGRLVEHKKPVGKLYKFFEYRRRKFRRGQQSLFAEKKNSIEMDDSGNNIVDQKYKYIKIKFFY
ncbi:hypothetical protein DERP_006586 [Dermatophagoides pteronyssinus]|uniref:Uncharacterized protein n=1 Tax=Dermatophagoides pteronyssinus TaxID=6956 RepID=A0ABQ8IQM7_DERPT|nr:hypothetical protein DERP_006586 [Dermatophagoides pteronyssinus]